MSSSNSSKTAHVMNLLSKNRGGAEPPSAPEESPAPKTESRPGRVAQTPTLAESPAPVAAPPVAPIISSINADAAVSSQIKDALEAELEGNPPKEAVRRLPPEPAADEPEEPAPPPLMDLPRTPENAPPPEEHHGYINVMQILVEEKADEYMKMFGICCCDKCRLDVRAVALNHLPPKYVVLSEHERVPRLTVYENRFASDITAQLIQACKQVMLTPHHSRPED